MKKHVKNIDENFPGHKLETQIHIRTQIRLCAILTLATKHLIIIKKKNSISTSKPFRST